MALSEQQKEVIRHPIRWFKSHGPEEIPRKELFSFALGTVGQMQMFGMAGGNWFFIFCNNVLMLKDTTVGKMTAAVTIADAFIDPMVGVAIDSHRFKDGRRLIPWIRHLAPFTAVMAFLLFVNWNLPGTVSKVVYCVGIFLLWDILYSFQNTSLMGMTAAISPHSMQRARSVQWMDIGVMIGEFPPQLLLSMLGGGDRFGLNMQQMYLLFAVIMCLGGGLTTLFASNTTERIRAVQAARKNPFAQIYNVLRHNRILLLFVIVDLLRAASPSVGEFYVYRDLFYNVGGREIAAVDLVLLLTVLVGLPGAFLKLGATKIAQRVGGMKNVMIIGAAADVVTRVVGFAFGIKTLPRFLLMYVAEMFSNIPWNLYTIAQRSLVSDSVDYVEWKTGQRTEGVTMSTRNLTAKLGVGLRRLSMGYSLNFLQHRPGSAVQNAHYNKWVWPVYKLGTGCGMALALIPLLMIRYPDSLRRQVESDLAQRRAMAEIENE